MYVLGIALARPVRRRVGALPLRTYARGLYLYVGSARGGLRGRVGRHLRAGHSGRWHVDTLLSHGEIVGVWWATDPGPTECNLARQVRRLGVSVPGFGASDCRCPSHLVALDGGDLVTRFRALSGRVEPVDRTGWLAADGPP